MKDFEDNYFDSVVTDPPYGISFMSKSWDYDVPQVELWKEVYRVLKPGGHILSFAGSRTYHRMAVNIEDAGFEIRDMLGWLYGSGFPKSHNIGKAIDKKGGNSISWFGEWLKNWRIENNVSQKDISKLFPSRTGGLTGCVSNWELGFNIPTPEQFSIIVKEFDLPFKTIKEAERQVVGKKRSSLGGTVAAGERNQEFINAHKNKEVDITIPKTEQAKQWEGWGTALKPAHEPIVMARKPFNTSVAENVLTHGTGGINIDECRVGTESIGRFPANIIHDGSEEVLKIFPETGKSSKSIVSNKNSLFGLAGGLKNKDIVERGHNDNGGTAARFFYCAKASKAERNMGLDNLAWEKENFETKKAGGMSGRNDGSMGSITYNKNHHPTVKPIKLMEYLVRLVTPKEGIVLEPFAGSGTTLIACKQQGFNYIGIEREQEYCDIAEARLKGVKVQGELF